MGIATVIGTSFIVDPGGVEVRISRNVKCSRHINLALALEIPHGSYFCNKGVLLISGTSTPRASVMQSSWELTL